MFESGGYNQVDNFSVKYRYQGLYRPNVWISRAADDFRHDRYLGRSFLRHLYNGARW